MSIACPNDEQLKSLIMEAFDELPAPEPARIGQIATTLNRKAVVTKRPRHHWLFWLLLGGSMTAAAWWGSDYFLPEQAETPLNIETNGLDTTTQPVKAKPDTEVLKETDAIREKTQSKTKISPIIDKRERY